MELGGSMKTDKLRSIFGTKIYLEFESYKKDMLSKTPEEIFKHSYQNDYYVRFYEELLELSKELTEMELSNIILIQNFMDIVYAEWISSITWSEDELSDFLSNLIRKICNRQLEVAQ